MDYDFEREKAIEESLEAQGNPLRREDVKICKRCGHSVNLHIGATGCNGHFSTGTLPRGDNQSEYCQCGGYE